MASSGDGAGGGGGGGRPLYPVHRCNGSCRHPPEPKLEEQISASLYPLIDRDSITCLNESVPNSGKNCIKPWEQCLDSTRVLRSSDDDPELILCIPFSTQVVLKSFCVVGGGNGTAPSSVKIFSNRSDIDFSNVSDLQPVQQFDLAEDFKAQIEYPTKVHKFQNVNSLTFYFKGDGDFLQIDYLGLKGLGTQNQRVRPTNLVYELRPNVADHPQTNAEHDVTKHIE